MPSTFSFLSSLDQPGHVARGALVVGVAVAARAKVLVERGQVDHADAQFLAAVLDLDELLLGGLLGDGHLLAHHGDDLVLAVQAGLGGNDLQAQRGVLLAADLGHHVVDAPADHVLDRALGALAHADDAIAHVDLAGLGGRAAGHHLAHHGVLVLVLQHRTDALQRELHGDVEVLRRARTEVVGVRVGGLGVGVHEGVERILRVQLVDAVKVALVALVQRLADVLRVLAGQLQAQPVVLHALAPHRVQRLLVGRPLGVLAIELVVLGLVEVEALLEQLLGVVPALGGALDVQIEDGERTGQVLVPDRVVELVAQAGEPVDVGLGEVQLVAVQVLQVGVEDLLRHRVVQRLGVVLEPREETRGQRRRLRLGRGRLERQGGGLGGDVGMRRDAGEGDQQHGQEQALDHSGDLD